MNCQRRSIYLFALLSACMATCYGADGPAVTISGFGTAALTATDTDDAEYVRPNQASGAKKKARTGVDSNFGLQATAKFSNNFSGTVQGLVRKNANDYYGAELAWAFLKYKFNDDFTFRLGRMGTPIYMISDFRNVGYANTMIRPPAEVYRQVNGGFFEGADVVYQHGFGDSTLTAQFGVGHSKTKSPGNSYVEFKPVTALHVLWENGPFTLRLGRADATFDVVDNTTLNTLMATLNSVGLTQVATDFKITDVKGSFTSVGAMLDYKNFLVQTEYAIRKTESRAVMDTTSWYAMFGYRHGKLTPYYYHGNVKQDSPRTYAGLPTTGPLAPVTGFVNAVAKAGLQSTDAIGVRWDFHKSAALKVQIDRVKPKDGAGAFINAKPAFTGPVNVYAAGIDFVF
jgi:hypothetical protein